MVEEAILPLHRWKSLLPTVRPPLKKSLFTVQRPGENIRAYWDLFFLIFDFFFFLIF